jgi:ppGpp synthetase/RelA/SpoT-type nucleotidyltranferase
LKELISQEEKISTEFIIQYRIKSLDSIFQAIEGKSLKVKSVREFDDLIGLRVILTFKREADLVCQLIRENLLVLVEKDIQAKLGEREFGYSSIHFIAEPPASWQSMPTIKKVLGFHAEIQVRSGAQHIWASASRVLQYKQEQNVPPPVRRAINRVSALLETVDLEFERVLEARALYRKKVEINAEGFPAEDLNVDLLEKVLDDYLPHQNKVENESYSVLLPELFHCSIRTPRQLVELLSKQRAKLVEQDMKMAQDMKNRASEDDRIRVESGYWWTHVGLVRRALQNEYGDDYKRFRRQGRLPIPLNEFLGKPKPPHKK